MPVLPVEGILVNFLSELNDCSKSNDADFKRIKADITAQLAAFKEKAKRWKAAQRKADGRPKTKLPSLIEANEEKYNDGIPTRAKRKTTKKASKLQNAVPVSKNSSKRNTPESPDGEPDYKTARKDETPVVERYLETSKRNPVLNTNCTVVLKRLTIEEIDLLQQGGTSKDLKVLISESYCSKTECNLSKKRVHSSPCSSERSESPDKNEQSGRAQKRLRSDRQVLESAVVISPTKNSGLTSTIPPKVGNSSKVETPNRPVSSKLTNSIDIFGSDVEKSENRPCTPINNVSQVLKKIKTPDETHILEIYKSPEEEKVMKADKLIESNVSNIEKLRQKGNTPVNSPESPVSQVFPAPSAILEVVPEKRITRSKMTKPPARSVDDNAAKVTVELSPEKRRTTRSKMAKPKENGDVQLRNSPSSENVLKGEVRITRSKMAKQKPQLEPEETESSDQESPKPAKRSPPPPSSDAKTNLINDLFTPNVVNRDQYQGKENTTGGMKTSERKGGKYTPLQVRNAFVTPMTKTKILSSAGKGKIIIEEVVRKKREEEILRKRQEEAVRKKTEIMKAKQEDIRRKNEEKQLKAAAFREAISKDTVERIKQMEKEKEERERAMREQLEKKKEAEAKKKMKEEAKALEAELRRQNEEAARQAKIREMEEEKRKEEELRLKHQEEAEKLRKQRLEEMRLKEAIKAKEMQKKKGNYVPPKDKDNYDIGDVMPGSDSDEDEDSDSQSTKKDIPMWARKGEDKSKQEQIHSLVNFDTVTRYFVCPSQTPDLTEFFGKMTMKRVRTSSAVWLDTPPLKNRS